MFMIALIAGMSLMVFGTRNSGILPSLVTFVLALQRLNGSFGAVAGNFSPLASNSAPIHRLNEILDTSDKQFRRQGGAICQKLLQTIQLEDVSLSCFPDSPPAVANVSLTIPRGGRPPRGHTVALVGASGAGMSSIADLFDC